MKSWEITKKDIRLLTRDARALFVLLVLPMIFITIIGLTMGKLFGWRNTNQILRIGVVNSIAYDEIGGPGWDDDDDDAKSVAPAGEAEADESTAKDGQRVAKSSGEPVLDAEEKIRQKEIAHNIVVKVINQLQKRSGFEVTEILTREQAETDVKNTTVQAAIVFGPNFYRRVSHLTPSDILDGQLKEGLELARRLVAGRRSRLEHLLADPAAGLLGSLQDDRARRHVPLHAAPPVHVEHVRRLRRGSRGTRSENRGGQTAAHRSRRRRLQGDRPLVHGVFRVLPGELHGPLGLARTRAGNAQATADGPDQARSRSWPARRCRSCSSR